MPEPSPDARRSPRLSPKGATRLEAFREPGGKGPDIAVRVLDISANGARIVLRERLPIGHALGFALYGPHLMPVAGTAVVVWAIDAGDGTFTTGINFQNPAGPDNVAALARG